MYSKSLTFDYVKKFIENEGYSLLSNEYVNNRVKLLMRCDKGHLFDMKFNDFQQNHRCPTCFGKNTLTYDYVKNFIESENYSLVSIDYKNNKQKLLMSCDKGHKFEMTFINFQQNHRCPVCHNEKIRKKFDNEFLLYKNIVYNLSNKNYRRYKHIINPHNLPRGRNKFHLDHKFSIYDGFVNNVPPEVISSVSNLQILSEHENISKHKESCLSLNELIEGKGDYMKKEAIVYTVYEAKCSCGTTYICTFPNSMERTCNCGKIIQYVKKDVSNNKERS